MAVLAAVGLGLQAFGLVTTALAKKRNAKLNAFIASGNAELAEIKARIVKKETDIAVSEKRKEGRSLLSTQRALIGTTGVTSGSFARTVEQTAMDNELDALAVQFRGISKVGEIKAAGGKQVLESAIQKGKARRAGFEALLSGLGSAAKIAQEVK